ncbi:MAG: ABC transporter ATP-binding protein [Pseudomonadota bacterium]
MKPSGDLISLLRRLWIHLGPRRRSQFLLLLGLMVVSVLAEIVSLSAVIPFIGALAVPEKVLEYRVVAWFARLIGASTTQQILLPLTIVFAVVSVIAGAIRLLFIWASTRFTFATGADLSIEVYRRTLYQPYEVHIRRSSSEVISGIATKVGGTMLGVVLPMTVLISQGLLIVAIMATLLAIDPVVAIVAALGFGSAYAIVTWLTNASLRHNGRSIAAEQTHVIKALQEGLGGIRDVLLDGSQAFYSEIYQRADRLLRRAQGNNIFIAQSPKPMIEAFGMVLIAGLAYGLSARPGGLAEGLTTLAVLALGAQRLLPALQSTYASWASMIGSEAVLADTIELLDQPLDQELLRPAPSPLVLERSIEFNAVRYRYAADGPWALDGLTLSIPRGARVGIVGGTGGGKSTTMDLLMGLLRPSAGEVVIDGLPLDRSRVRAWQRAIAHVPQTIYLTDATLAENIALGESRDKIDIERVKIAAQRAHIAELIESRPRGYDEIVGERGVRLSGGQRQRIGIARALYKQASVLVLDEATSALDNVTERSVMDAIDSLDRGLTILVIAHRLTTVRRCDFIVQIEGGRVAAQGTYEALLESSPSFRQMAHAVPS